MIVRLLLFFASIPFLAGAKEFCALRVDAVDALGRKVSGKTASLVNEDGEIVQSNNLVDGEVSFCDIGFGRHEVRFGAGCASTTLHHIRLVYGLEQRYKVILNDCLIGADGGRYPPSCLAYLRIASGRVPIPQAHVSKDGTVVEADGYGRAWISVRTGKRELLHVSALGFEDRTFEVSCKSMETIEIPAALRPAQN